MRVQDIMTTDVVSIAPDASIADALDLMTNSRVSGLPVVDAARHLVGIVSEADFLRRLELGTAGPSASWLTQFLLPGRAAEVFTRARAYRVDEVMRVNVVTIDEEATLAEAVALMERESVKRLPVIADDFVRALAKLARRKYPVNAISDDEIRHRVRAEMRAQPWGPVATVDVAVKDGVVSLRGILTDERVRTAMHALTEGVYGVAAIEDHMTCVEPLSGVAV
jgi:CBS domain-containing protein